MRDHGLEQRAVESIAFTHRVANADELWEGLLEGPSEPLRSSSGSPMRRGGAFETPGSTRERIPARRRPRASGLRQARLRSQAGTRRSLADTSRRFEVGEGAQRPVQNGTLAELAYGRRSWSSPYARR